MITKICAKQPSIHLNHDYSLMHLFFLRHPIPVVPNLKLPLPLIIGYIPDTHINIHANTTVPFSPRFPPPPLKGVKGVVVFLPFWGPLFYTI